MYTLRDLRSLNSRRDSNRFRCSWHFVLFRMIFATFLVLVTIPQNIVAQEETDESGEDDLDVIMLSPFEVDASEDVGYRSTNSTAGTSLNTKLKDLPMSIEVINKEFLSDIGATNFKEALQYSAGVSTDNFRSGTANGANSNGPGANAVSGGDVSASTRGGLGGRFDNGTNIRGFNVSFQNREGFRYGGLIANYGIVLGGILDTSNISRMEVVRGPNSLLYGIGVLSGIVNVVAGRPLSEQREFVSIGVGNDGYRRGTVEVTGPLKKDLWGGELSYRVVATGEHRDNWTQFREKDLEYYAGSLQFKNERWNALFEWQYADQKESGIGPQFLYDNLAASVDPNFRNEFGEQYNWQKDFGGLDQSTRVSGPDTYDQREETNFMAIVDFTPIDNLTISAGAFITSADQERFDMNLATLTNESGGFQLKRTLVARANDALTDPAIKQKTQDFLDLTADIRAFPGVVDPLDRRDLQDYRVTRYWWRKTPESTTTEQYRIRAAYSFETKDLWGDQPAKHTFLIGRHDIKDTADVITRGEAVNNQFTIRGELADDDPLLFRRIDDHTPIRYNGERLTAPGLDMRNLEVWYQGHFALYQGSLLNNRLGVIAGVRHDRYHARDQLYDRYQEAIVNPLRPLASPPAGVISDNTNNETFGFLPAPEGVTLQTYRPGPEAETEVTKTFALNYKLSEKLTLYGMRGEGLTPNTGALDGNGEGIDAERTTSTELGLKFDILDKKISGSVSVYKIKRENALWNLRSAPSPIDWVGGAARPGETPTERDDAFDPTQITPDSPLNYGINDFYLKEDGIQLGKVTKFIRDANGTITGRTIEFPEGYLGANLWFGSDLIPQNYVYFDYAKIDELAVGKDGSTNGKTWRHYLEKAYADRGRSRVGFRGAGGPDDFDPVTFGKQIGNFQGNNPSHRSGTGTNVTYTDEATGYDLQMIFQPTNSLQFVFNYAHTEREAISTFQLAEVFDPDTGIQFGTEYDDWVRVLGRAAFGLEEHDDDGDGVFDRVTKIGETGVLGVGDVPTSSLVGGIQGLSLFTQPEDSASLFSKYTFEEGVLKGLSPNIGVRYVGPAKTTTPIGGNDLAENRFGTPPTAERYSVNMGLIYRWKTERVNYRLQLNVYNLLDDQKGLSVVDYSDATNSEVRRTLRFYTPRNFRLSLSMQF